MSGRSTIPMIVSMAMVSAHAFGAAEQGVVMQRNLSLGLAKTIAEAGVRRISVGGALARAAWTGFLSAAREIATVGTFTTFARNIPVPEMNKLFGAARRHDQS